MAEDVLFSTKIDVEYRRAEKDIAALQKKIDNATRKREVIVELKTKSDNALATARAELERSQARLQQMQEANYGKLVRPFSDAQIAEAENDVKTLQAETKRLTEETAKYQTQIDKADGELSQMTATLKEAEKNQMQVPSGVKDTAGHFDKAAKSASNFGKKIKSLLSKVTIIALIAEGLKKVRDWFTNLIQTNAQTQNAINNLKLSLSTLAAPLVNTILPIITKVINALATLISFFASGISRAFGTTLADSAASAQAMAGGFDDASGSAKELKKTLAGYDQLEVIQQDEDTGGAGGGMSIGSIELPESELLNSLGNVFGDLIGKIRERIGGLFDQIVGWVKQINWEPLLNAVISLLKTIIGLLDPIFDIIQDVFNFLEPIIQKFIEKYLPRIIKVIDKIISAIGKVLEAVEPIIESILELLEPIVDAANEIGTIIFELVGSGIEDVLDIVRKVLEKITPLIQTVFSFLRPILELLSPILELIGELASMIGDILGGALKIVIDLITLDFEAAKEDFAEIIESLKAHIENLKQKWEDFKQKVVEVWERIKTAAKDAWEGIKGVWQGVKDWFQRTIIDPLVRAWDAATSAIGNFFSNIWQGIKSGFVNAINAVIGGLEAAINWMVDAINGFLSGINWVIQGIGKIFGADWSGIGYVNYVSLGRIPALATGGVIPPNNKFLAMLGDNKKEEEVVSPLSTMKQALAEVMAEYGGGSKEPIILQIDGKTVAQVVWNENEKRYKQTGRTNPAFA